MPTLSQAQIEKITLQVEKGIRDSVFGGHLMNKFPLKMVSPTVYSEQYKLLKKTGSPAATDGKNVFFSSETMSDLLSQQYYEFSRKGFGYSDDRDWDIFQVDKEHPIELDEQAVRRSIRVILLHEYTHAFNEHCKLRVSMKTKSPQYQTRLNIACEIQANDGILGEYYARDYIQQPEGVTNKRLFPETIGYHSLRAIMEHLPNDNDPRMKAAGGQASKDGDLREQIMKSTGEYDKQEQELNGTPEAHLATEEHAGESKIMERSTETALTEEIKEIGMTEVKNLMLASLSDELKYDPTSKSVIYEECKKRVVSNTYARPSRRIGMYGNQPYQVIRKGKKTEWHKIPEKTNHLTVLAVDCSGSMTNNERYVAAITDKLLKQVGEIAEQKHLTVDYNNLQATLHESGTQPIVPITSEDWKQRMRRYRACGGNDFSQVLHEIAATFNVEDYEEITIINLSDGLDWIQYRAYAENSPRDQQLLAAIESGKVKWIDAIIDEQDVEEAKRLSKRDDVEIRKQVLLNVRH